MKLTAVSHRHVSINMDLKHMPYIYLFIYLFIYSYTIQILCKLGLKYLYRMDLVIISLSLYLANPIQTNKEFEKQASST